MEKVCFQTNRLVIRSLKKKDAKGLLELLSKPRVNCFVDEKIETIEEAYKYIENSNSEFDLAVCLKESNEFIGLLFGMLESKDTYSPCWNFLPEYGGKGYAFEAVKEYFNYLFNTKNIRRIYAYTEDYNVRSQNLCKKLGMRQEGFYKEFISFINDENGRPIYENTYEFAILKKEWDNK